MFLAEPLATERRCEPDVEETRSLVGASVGVWTVLELVVVLEELLACWVEETLFACELEIGAELAAAWPLDNTKMTLPETTFPSLDFFQVSGDGEFSTSFNIDVFIQVT